MDVCARGYQMKQIYQTTLQQPVTLKGIGVHFGQPATITLYPAEPHHGIVFLRRNMPSGHERLIEARHMTVSATALCTIIGERDSGAVATIEHLMSALSGLGVDNVLVDIDGPEVPILDGSASPFVEAIDQAGLVVTDAPRRFIRVLKKVRAVKGNAYTELAPASNGFQLDVEIDFNTALIGRQRKIFNLSPSAYRREIAGARTFGFMRDVEQLRKSGYALGASLENTVALTDDVILNKEGLRYGDEFVRHKLLDAIGDLALAGLPLIASYTSYCGGHALNVAVLEELFSSRHNYKIVDALTRSETNSVSSVPVAAFAQLAKSA